MPVPARTKQRDGSRWSMRAGITALSLSVLSVVLITAACVDALARDPGLIDWIHSRQVEKWPEGDYIAPRRGFLFGADRLLLEEIPERDYSEPGVFLFGSSNLATAIATWRLPQEQRSLIHDHSIAGSSHTTQTHLIEYLIEHKGWLADGAEKTLAIFGIFYGNAKRSSWVPPAFQQGLYLSNLEGWRPGDASALEWYLRTERLRCRNFLTLIPKILYVTDDLRIDVRPYEIRATQTYEEEFKSLWTSRMGPDWEWNMTRQLKAFEASIDLLQQHEARIAVVLLPIGSWHHDLPFQAPFAERVSAICREKSVPMTDLSRLLDDDEFVDRVHMNYAGAQKTHKALMGLTLEHLRRTDQ